MKIRNFTPHTISVFDTDKTTIITEFPSEGIARVSTTQEVIGEVNGIQIQKISFGEVKGLPDPEENTVYLVSKIVVDALKGKREDVVAPDTGKGAVRNEDGQILGTLNFAV